MENIKRSKTTTACILALIGYIIGTGFYALTTYYTWLISAIVGSLGGEFSTMLIALVPFIVMFFISFIGFILSICQFKHAKYSKEEYSKKKGSTITLIVFGFIELAYALYIILMPLINTTDVNAATSLLSVTNIIEYSLIVIPTVIASILLICDLVNNKKLPDSAELKQGEQPTEKKEALTIQDKIDKIAKLAEMKKSGLITDEEYEKMKKDLQ